MTSIEEDMMKINKFQSRLLSLVTLSFAFVMAPSLVGAAQGPLQTQNADGSLLSAIFVCKDYSEFLRVPYLT